jgi:sulfite exporter TauE/SafE
MVLLIGLGGLTGAGHCLGMCGGFALRLGIAPGSRLRLWTRQLIYGLGRVFTYVFLGILVGAAGLRVRVVLPSMVTLQAWLGVAAGLALIVGALTSFGVLFRLAKPRNVCLWADFFGMLLSSARSTHVLLGGIVNGMLPCGLVYSYLTLAASTLNPVQGGLLMAVFGSGTILPLAIFGYLGGRVPVQWHMSLRRIGGWCMLLTGLITLLRGGLSLYGPVELGPGCHVPKVFAPGRSSF